MESDGAGLRYRLRRLLRQIGDQHRSLGELHARLRRAIRAESGEEARDALHHYREAVGAHFALEDEVFFPALHGLDPAWAGELEALSGDHDGLRDALGRLDLVLEQQGLRAFADGFDALRVRFAAHEEREERVVSRLSGAVLAE